MSEEVRDSGRLGGLLKHSIVYTAAPLLRQAITLAMTRFYTEWLQKPGFGLKDVLDFWIIGLQQLLGLGVLNAMVRFYYDARDPEDRARTVSSCTLLVALLGWSVCGAAFVLTPWLKPLMLGQGDAVQGDDLVVVLRLLFLLVPLQLSTMSGLYYLVATQRSAAHTTIQTVKLLLEVGLNFLFIGHLDMGVEGFLTSMLIGELLTSIGLLTWMFTRLGARLDMRLMRPVLAYALPLVAVGLCQLGLHNLDRRLILKLAPAESAWAVAGVYGLAYKIGYLVTAMLLAPFLQIFHPWVFDIDDERERAAHVARVGTWAVLAVGLASLAVILFGRQATAILDGSGDFWEAYRVIPFVAAAYVFWTLYRVTELPLYVAKRTGRLLSINVVAVTLNVALNFALIPRYGFVGAGVATAITLSALAVLGMVASHVTAGVRFEHGRLATILSVVIVGGAAALWIDGRELADELPLVAAIALKATLLAGGTVLLGFRILEREERARLFAWARRRLGR